MKEKIKRVILAFKRTISKKLKRRSAIDRYKARQYYRSHKIKIKKRRKDYMKKNRTFIKTRKLFKRTKPTWATKKPKIHKPKKPKLYKPKRPRKPYAPKRSSKPKR